MSVLVMSLTADRKMLSNILSAGWTTDWSIAEGAAPVGY